MQREIERIQEGDIIEESTSSYSNLLVVVMKKDGRLRLCLDTRRINQISIPNREAPEGLMRFSDLRWLDI